MTDEREFESPEEEVEAAREVWEQIKVYWLIRGVLGLVLIVAASYAGYRLAGWPGVSGISVLAVLSVTDQVKVKFSDHRSTPDRACFS